ncbi:MAG: prephenate dehydratase [Bacteroidetes Order II. Incertae sedis bacterium]|nr:prephenate dehydratase [Bacteroidetes Order II. bacterium]
MRVAYQGEPGAFSEYAALKLLGDNLIAVPKPSFEQVYDALESGEVDKAVVPIENSLFGSVHVNYDLLRKHPFRIVGELKLRVVHNLMVLPGVKPDQIRYVYSHWQALGQCQDFLRFMLPQAQCIDAYDTAGAAKVLAEHGYPHAHRSAAIASVRAAQYYGLEILATRIESDHQNYTRFLVLQPESAPIPHWDMAAPMKTSVVFAHKEDLAGALFKSLAVFALRDIDLLKIESRPLVGSPWVYVFYLDIQGQESDEAVQKALDHLSELTAYLNVLGSYPVGATIE